MQFHRCIPKTVLLVIAMSLTCCLIAGNYELESFDYTPSNLSLPDYFVQNRVHLHTRLSIFQYRNDPLFWQAEGHFVDMGVKVYTRWCKGKNEGAWWPSSVGAIEPLTYGEDLAEQMINRAHNEGMNIILYHRHMEDQYMAQLHPDWICRNKDGGIASSGRGDIMCMNSPYLDYFTTRMLELVNRGADGFYFDESHLPSRGCWCSYCQSKYIAQTGGTIPNTYDYGDPDFLAYLQFKNETIIEGFEHYRNAVHAVRPGLPMIISITHAGWLYNPKLRSSLMRAASSPKWEFEAPIRKGVNTFFSDSGTSIPVPRWDIQMAFAHMYMRDSAQGRPGHFWSNGLHSEKELLAASSELITYGHIANIDVPEETIPNSAFTPALLLGQKVGPYLAGTRPVRWAAIHFSEDTRDLYLTDLETMYRTLIVPCWQSFQALNEIGAPVGTLTDDQLRENEIAGYKVIILPPATVLTAQEQQNLTDFENSGGVVIHLNDDPRWYTDGQQASIRSEFLNQALSQVGLPPISMAGAGPGIHTVAVKKPGDPNTVIVNITNEFTWPACVQENRLDITYHNDGPEIPPSPVSGIRIFVKGPVPKKVFDVVSGQRVRAVAVPGGIEVEVPRLEYLATLVIDYSDYRLEDLIQLCTGWLQQNWIRSDENLGGIWSFEDGSGSTAMDSSGQDYHGTLINMEEEDWVGSFDGGTALSFDGSNEYVLLPDRYNLDFNAGGITWSLWVRTSVTNGQVLMSKAPDDMSSIQGDKRLHMTPAGNIQLLSTGMAGAVPSVGTINDGQWHHIAMTVSLDTSGSNDTVKLYIDSQQDGGSTNTRDINKFTEDGFFTFIGNGPGAGCNGVIDEVRIYHKPLNQDDITKLYNGTEPSEEYECLFEWQDGNFDCNVDYSDFAELSGGWLNFP